MSNFIHKDNHGSIFVNNDKKTEQQPDRRGSCVVGGVEYRLSGWLRKNAKGEPFLSIAFTPKDDTPNPPSKDDIDW